MGRPPQPLGDEGAPGYHCRARSPPKAAMIGRRRVPCLLAAIGLALASPAAAQSWPEKTWPDKPIKLIVPFAPSQHGPDA